MAAWRSVSHRRSQQSLLQLTNSSSHLPQGVVPTAAKTYSTRRGPLLLYTQDQVSMTTAHQSHARARRNGQGSRPGPQELEEPIRTQRSSVAAIVNSGNKKDSSFSSRAVPSRLPPLNLPPVPDLRHTTLPPLWRVPSPLFGLHPIARTTAPRLTSRLKARRWGRSVLRIQRFSWTPLDPEAPRPRLHYYRDMGLEGMDNTWIPGVTRRGGFPPVIPEEGEEEGEEEGGDEAGEQQEEEREEEETAMVGPAGGDMGLKLMVDSSWKSSPLAQITYYGGHWPGDKRGEQGLHTVLLDFPMPQQVQWNPSPQPEKQKQGVGIPLDRSRPGTQGAEPSGRQGPEEPLGGPLLFLLPEASGTTDPQNTEMCAPVGVMRCFEGRRGPGRQSSLAALQSRQLDPRTDPHVLRVLQDLQEPGGGSGGVVRGTLPQVLREFQAGRSMGSLLLGPDGEVLQLSLYENHTERLQLVHLDDVTEDEKEGEMDLDHDVNPHRFRQQRFQEYHSQTPDQPQGLVTKVETRVGTKRSSRQATASCRGAGSKGSAGSMFSSSSAVMVTKEQLMLDLVQSERALLEQQLSFQRGLLLEAEGLETGQDISRPWVYSYLTLLDLLGLPHPDPAEPDL
ncbi:unnamed protein product [Lota lota]